MRAIRTALIAASVLAAPAMVQAQSSSPFSGLFGRGSQSDGPVSLTVNIAGDDGGLERSIRNTSLIRGALDEDRTTGQDVLAAARGDYARILGALYDQGRYSAIITITLDGVEASQIAPLDAPDTVTDVIISVDPGPEFTFARAGIAPVAPESEIPSDYAVGRVASTGTIKSAAAAGVTGWRNQGYAKAAVGGQNIVADHNVNKVESDIALAPGPVVSFGRLNTQGNERLRTARLRKITGYPEGTRYDPDEIEDVRKRLRRTGIFSAITLEEAETLNPDNSMDVNLTVVEQKPRRIGAGFEISTTDGAQVSAYWMHRNLLGGGERLRIDVAASDISSDTSGLDNAVTLRLERPATFHPDITAFFETSAARRRGEEEDDYDSDLISAAFGVNYIYSDRLTGDAAIEYRFLRVTDNLGETDFKVVAFPLNLTYDARDVPTNAKSGYWLSGDAVPFIGFGDTDSGAQLIGEGRAYRSFGQDDRLTFATRGRIGTILGSDIENTPRDYLFYSGGGGSVRGQPFESLDVNVIQDGNGNTISTGGMSVANATAEVRFQIREKIGAVAFADFGRIWTEGSFGGDSASHSGAGVGIRYLTPIGPLRFDVAGPIGGDTGEGVQLYLGLGQAF